MQFDIQSTISPFISSQFPEFYKTEGPNFIAFVQAYYEFLEQEYAPTFTANGTPTSTNVLYQSRNLLNYRDIDNTLEDFLEHFQKKFLYGIPFNVIINKRFLLKHILDVYRSKGAIQCYKLLFRLIYNEDVEVYLPGRDLLAPSDGTWVIPKYLEVSYSSYLPSLVGRTIVGMASGATAVVENFITESINNNLVNSLYISNVLPKGGAFEQGEKIVAQDDNVGGEKFVQILQNAPIIIGSLTKLNIVNGGQGFKVGDILAVVHRDISNNAIISFGINGAVRVTSLTQAFGSLSFSIRQPGFGITSNPTVLVYPGNGNTPGSNAGFNAGAIGNTQTAVYNTDVIANYLTMTLDAPQYNFPANPTANLTNNVGAVLSYASNTFGSLITITNMRTGQDYTVQSNSFIRSVQDSQPLPGTVNFNTAANTITGSGTNFTWYFANNSFIRLQANPTTFEYATIKQVISDTFLLLYGPPKNNSNGTSAFMVSPAILPANFTPSDPLMKSLDDTINGLNTFVDGFPSSGNGVIGTADLTNSGKGYVDNELVQLYLYSGVNTPVIRTGGINYSNGDGLVFSGGGGAIANGFVTTNSNGTIISATVIYAGSGYTSVPVVSVKSRFGTGAQLTTSLSQFNTLAQVQAMVQKSGQGAGGGYWSTTRGFLNSDKYIQDSYFYQDFSYQLRAATQLESYENILYDTFHPAGSELFGQFLLVINEQVSHAIIYESSFTMTNWVTIDMGSITADAANTASIPHKYTVDAVNL